MREVGRNVIRSVCVRKIPDEEDERYAECIEFAKEQLQKEDVVEKQTSGEES